MSIQKQVLETIKRFSLIQKGDSIVVGVSGGPDSVCLLHVLYSLADELNMGKLYAVHINHMLRGEESDCDAKYVTDLCSKLGIELFIKECNIKQISKEEGISLEEAGREARYEQFNLVCKKTGAEKIAVAHNKNDQAETILLNIVRGTGLEGLRGMDYVNGRIVRPLLGTDRKAIVEYCAYKELNPRIDSSNLENIYTRNKVRLDLIPYIDRLFQTDITDKLVKTSIILKEDNDYIEENVINIYNHCVINGNKHEVQLDLLKVCGLHRAVQKRIIRIAVRKVKGNLKGIENVHIEDTLSIMINGRTGTEIHLPSNLRIKRSYNTLKITVLSGEKENIEICEKDVKIPGETIIHGFSTSIISSFEMDMQGRKSHKPEQNSFIQVFDHDKIKGGIKIRSRKDGDLFKPYKSTGTKKLKEYFIDNKVPKEERDKIPVLAKDNEIVWVIGHKISDKFKVTENTKSIIKLEYKKSEENT
jgi:tRNA(Ile)-lysidine synthase